MLRTTVGWSFSLMLLLGGALGGAAACSSSGKDEGTGGKGGIVTGGSSGTGGTGTGRSGSGGTGGGCVSTCADAQNEAYCDPATGQVEVFNCADDFKEVGFISKGCDAAKGLCTLDDAIDPDCLAGAQAFASCEDATNAEFFNIYVNCFQDNEGGHEVVTCFNDYVTEATFSAATCLQAEDACLGDGTGTGTGGTGTGGTGGGGGTGGTGGSAGVGGSPEGGAP